MGLVSPRTALEKSRCCCFVLDPHIDTQIHTAIFTLTLHETHSFIPRSLNPHSLSPILPPFLILFLLLLFSYSLLPPFSFSSPILPLPPSLPSPLPCSVSWWQPHRGAGFRSRSTIECFATPLWVERSPSPLWSTDWYWRGLRPAATSGKAGWRVGVEGLLLLCLTPPWPVIYLTVRTHTI